jgi:hypothetical protein
MAGMGPIAERLHPGLHPLFAATHLLDKRVGPQRG